MTAALVHYCATLVAYGVCKCSGGGGAAPAGPEGAVQYRQGNALAGSARVRCVDDGNALAFGAAGDDVAQSGDMRLPRSGFAARQRNYDGDDDAGVWGADDEGRCFFGAANGLEATPENRGKVAWEAYVTAREWAAATLIEPDLIIPGTAGPLTHYPAHRLHAIDDPTATGEHAGKRMTLFSVAPHVNFALIGGRNHIPTADDFGRGRGVAFLGHANRNPSVNPYRGVVLYVDSADDVLKYRKPNGETVTLDGSAVAVRGVYNSTLVSARSGGGNEVVGVRVNEWGQLEIGSYDNPDATHVYGGTYASFRAPLHYFTDLSVSPFALINDTAVSLGRPVGGLAEIARPFRLRRVELAGAPVQELTPAQYECPIVHVASTGDGQIVILPLVDGATFIVRNTGSGVGLTFRAATGTGVAVGPNTSKMIYCDGTNYLEVG